MSKQANKTVIGAFVIGAIALVVAGVLIFGSGKFLKARDSYVLYFEGSVKGLNIGSPVLFRGVKVGSVTDIRLQFDPEDLTVYIPVVIEVEPDRFRKESNDRNSQYNVKLLIDKGLRAQLELQSMVTGQLMINFDFQPDEPANLTGISSKYVELPTIPSDMEKLSRTIENIPFDELMNKLTSAVGGLERVMNSPELIGSAKAAEKALKEIHKLVKNVDSQVAPLVLNIKDTSDAARSAFEQAEKTFAFEEGVPGELASGIKETLTSASDALKQSRHTLSSVQEVVANDSDLVYKLNNTLHELSGAARSIRFLADYLERHPESIVRGKGSSKGE
ncbi:MAG: MlaD family protein [Nitrospirota bacterium]